MIIGFTGTHGVGKTTLLNEMKKDKRFNDFEFYDGITRKLNNDGSILINDNHSDYNNTQEILINAHVNLIENNMNNKIVMDRTLLDVMVYTHYLFLNNKVNYTTFSYAFQMFNKYKKYYDILFYIRPEFDLIGDGVRSVDLKFKDGVFSLFENYIDNMTINNCQLKILKGDIENRYTSIIRKIYDYD